MTSPAPAFAPALVAAHQRRIISRFQSAGATGPDSARAPEDLGVSDRRTVSALLRAGVLAEHGEGRFFVNPNGLARWNRRRLWAAAAVGLLLVAGLAIALITGAF